MRVFWYCILVCWMCSAQAEDSYPVDERFRELETKLTENTHECVERSSGGRQCATSERQKLERSFPFRGTRQYVRQYYLPQDTKQLLRTRDELRTSQGRARSQQDFWVDAPRPAGELTKEMLSFELGLIEKELETRKRKGRTELRNATRDLKRVLN